MLTKPAGGSTVMLAGALEGSEMVWQRASFGISPPEKTRVPFWVTKSFAWWVILKTEVSWVENRAVVPHKTLVCSSAGSSWRVCCSGASVAVLVLGFHPFPSHRYFHRGATAMIKVSSIPVPNVSCWAITPALSLARGENKVETQSFTCGCLCLSCGCRSSLQPELVWGCWGKEWNGKSWECVGWHGLRNSVRRVWLWSDELCCAHHRPADWMRWATGTWETRKGCYFGECYVCEIYSFFGLIFCGCGGAVSFWIITLDFLDTPLLYVPSSSMVFSTVTQLSFCTRP